MKPWMAPTRAPRPMPTASAITQIQELSPMLPRSNLTLKKAITPSVWTSAIDVAEEAEQRADRQVDVPRHDDQHHARRHDGDRGALHREVPQVPGGEEVAARQDVERDPDDDDGGDHPEQSGVDLGRREARTPRPCRRRCRRRCGDRGGGADGTPPGTSVSRQSSCSPPRHRFRLYTKRAPRPRLRTGGTSV